MNLHFEKISIFFCKLAFKKIFCDIFIKKTKNRKKLSLQKDEKNGLNFKATKINLKKKALMCFFIKKVFLLLISQMDSK